MRMYDIITKKKNGLQLTKEEIRFVVQGYTKKEIPDYQMSALLMAICLNHMNMRETTDLTTEMANSGELLDLSEIHGIKADKHSTGGVGDKTSFIVGPIVASLGVPVAKMSGRGLGHTGGTIDKLESIPGMSTNLSKEQFVSVVNNVKMAICSQTANLAPADKGIYALRDVTATVDNISLIASSIMSKKLAAGSDVIVLDVKVGSGAFMKTKEAAKQLAKVMVSIGRAAGKKTYAVITDMNQPLGHFVGNALEVREAVNALQNKIAPDLREACEALASYMLLGAGRAKDIEEARRLVNEAIENKSAYNKFIEFVGAQGGDISVIEDTTRLVIANRTRVVYSHMKGYVERIDTDQIGIASLELGGGRETKESIIDTGVGIEIHKKIGDYVTVGEPLATLYENDDEKAERAAKRLLEAYHFTDHPVPFVSHVLGVISDETISPDTILS